MVSRLKRHPALRTVLPDVIRGTPAMRAVARGYVERARSRDEDFRVFFGPADAVDERIVHSVARQLDGGTTTIELELDGAAATAYFPVELQGDPEPWTLTVADETIALQRRDAVPDGVSYRCLVE